MPDTFTSLWNRLLLRAPAVGAALSQDLVRDAFNQLCERRSWSWLRKSGAFFPPTLSSSGTVAVATGSLIVTGTGTAFDSSLVGKQIRAGGLGAYPAYTITSVLSATSLVLDQAWSGPNASGLAYVLFQCYFPMPSDFKRFESVVNVTSNYKLWHNITQAELDLYDPQRVQQGITFALAQYDYTKSYSGLVGAAFQVRGTGPTPVSTTSTGFSYPSDSTYVIEITTGGAVGVADFKWRQDSGSYTTGVLTSGSAIDLSNGVQIYFPDGTYVLGDIFVVQCRTDFTTGVPRYELWPRPIDTPYVYPYLYIARTPELTDSAPSLPPPIAARGDVVLEIALAGCARFPGADGSNKNPYYNLDQAKQHDARAERMLNELEIRDDETGVQDLKYAQLNLYPAPWLDGSWQQTHAIYPG